MPHLAERCFGTALRLNFVEMPFSHEIFRFLSIFLIALGKQKLSGMTYYLLFVVLIFDHQLWAFLAPIHQKFKHKTAKKRVLFLLALATAAAATLYSVQNRLQIDILFFYFGIHFVMSEAYLDKTLVDVSRKEIFLRLSYYSLTYFCLTNYFKEETTSILFLSCILIFFVRLFYSYQKNRPNQFMMTGLTFIIFNILIQVKILAPLTGVDIAFYHIIFYLFFIYTNKNFVKDRALITQLGLSIGTICIFYLIATQLNTGNAVSFFGFMHISYSFILSKYNPDFVLTYVQRWTK